MQCSFILILATAVLIGQTLNYNPQQDVALRKPSTPKKKPLNDMIRGLSIVVDQYNQIHIDSQSLPENLDECKSLLQINLQSWEKAERRAVFIDIPKQRIQILPYLVKQLNFNLHHVNLKTQNQEQQSILLTKWLDQNMPSMIPPYSTHYIGVGGFVMNKSNEVLVVKQKMHVTQTDWKLPGGVVQAQQNLVDAVLRQVKEETGVIGKFIGILGGRQMKNFRFNRPDIFFVSLIQVDESIQGNGKIIIQQQQIKEARWVHINQLLTEGFSKSYIMNTILDFIRDTIQNGRDNGCKVSKPIFEILKDSSMMAKQASHIRTSDGKQIPSYLWFPAKAANESNADNADNDANDTKAQEKKKKKKTKRRKKNYE